MSDENTRPFADRAWNQTSAKSCALQLFWLKQDREPKMVRPDRLAKIDRRNRGTALHDFARLSLHLLFAKGKYPDAEKTLRAVLKSGGGKDWPGSLLGFMGGAGFPELVDSIGELLPKAELFQERFQFVADNRIGSEHFVAIDADGGVANYFEVPAGGYHGRIDWAELSRDNQLRVIDFKNRPAIHPNAELKAHEQLSFYAWMLAKHYPQARQRPLRQGIYYFEYGVTNEVEISWDVVDANVERLLTRIRQKRALRIIDIVAEPGFDRCQYCEFIGDCPAGSKLLENRLGAIVDNQSAIDACKSIFVMTELLDATKDGLKRYCEQNGPVFVDIDLGYGFKEDPDYSIDSKQVMKLLKDSGMNPFEVIGVSRQKLEKLAKSVSDDLRKKINDLIIVDRTGTKFTAFKPKKDKVMATPKVRGRVRTPKDRKSNKQDGGDVATPNVK